MAELTQVVVDEGVGDKSVVLQRFRQWLGGRSVQWLYIAQKYPGLPDIEILSKLLGPGIALVTTDRVLHNHACKRGYRSWTLDAKGNLTRRKLKGIRLKRLPPSLRDVLHFDYEMSYHPIAITLAASLTPQRQKRLRKARRRIRSHFGSQEHITHAAVTIGARPVKRSVYLGFKIRLTGKGPTKGLDATEGYARVIANTYAPEQAVFFALAQLYLLQLNTLDVDLFVIPESTLGMCHRWMMPTPAHPPPQLLAIMLSGLSEVHIHSCLKGVHFDKMQTRLSNFKKGRTNELQTVDFDDWAYRIAQEGIYEPEDEYEEEYDDEDGLPF